MTASTASTAHIPVILLDLVCDMMGQRAGSISKKEEPIQIKSCGFPILHHAAMQCVSGRNKPTLTVESQEPVAMVPCLQDRLVTELWWQYSEFTTAAYSVEYV